MKKLLIVLFSVGLLTSISAKAEKILYCPSELAAGFISEDGIWSETTFEIKRYTMKFKDDFSGVIIKDEQFSCYDGGPFQTYHPIICKSDLPYSSWTLNIDKISLRYVLTQISVGGYASTRRNSSDTDSIIAGTCEKF